MTPHTRYRAALLTAAVLILLFAAAVGAEEPQDLPGPGESLDQRIVGGVEVQPPGKYPFIVALVFASEPDTYWGQYCAGTLIDPWWVLTAGHCVSFPAANQPWEVDVVAGRHDLRYGTDGERIGVTDIYLHPGYDDTTLANDLALLRLERATVAAAPLPLATAAEADLFAPGDLATAIGWGATLGNPPGTPNYPDTLREVQVPIVSDADCAAAYGSEFIPPGQVCAGDLLDGGVDSCYGDSGGPLFVADGAGYLHVGIVSTGKDCALAGFPGIYTRTATYVEWVQETMAVNPVPLCRGRTATLVGTIKDDVLRGTIEDDVIVGRAGNDEIYGDGGADTICAGAGRDLVDAGAGADVVIGGSGGDRLHGGLGHDFLAAGPGRDRLYGGDGDDRLYGGADTDVALGEAGDDLIYGGEGPDRLYGGEGRDALSGFGGDDRILGGPGDDELTGGEGFDFLRGGRGLDRCFGGEDVVCEVVRLAFHLPQ